uniref:PH domain-containing protein n=1 Tax=Echinococcus granulosus TaxID=6210 RepID=A0A068WAE4_ECHGR|nr:hypothetical protein EgrG_000774400 [Echinococcus granulosus]
MAELSQFPCRVESWLLVWALPERGLGCSCANNGGTRLPKPEWKPFYCVCREDEARLNLYVKEEDARIETTPRHLHVCRFNCVRPFSSGSDAYEENTLSGPSSFGSPVLTSYAKKKNHHIPGRHFWCKNHRRSEHGQAVQSWSKSTACLVEKAPAGTIYSEDVFLSHPGELDSASATKPKFSRHGRGKVQASFAKRGFSLSHFIRRSAKTPISLPEDDEEVSDGWHSPQEPPTLGRIYLSSSINLGDSGSWTSLLEEQTRQTPVVLHTNAQQTCKTVDDKHIPAFKDSQTANANTLKPVFEQSFKKAQQPGAPSVADPVCLQKSCANLSTDESSNITAEPAKLRQWSSALRKRLLSRSQQLLDKSTSSRLQNHEIDIKSGELEFGRFQASLLGGQEHCFYVKTLTGETHIFAAASRHERNCWLTRCAS